MKSPTSRLPSFSAILFRSIALIYGLVCFIVIATRAVWEGYVTKRPSRQFWQDVENDRKKLWDLSAPVPGKHNFRHQFEQLSTGVRMHYLSNISHHDSARDGPQRRKNLVIFLHGFPDSCMIWLDVMSDLEKRLNGHASPGSQDTAFTAVDLPGFGGSDGVSRYGPEEVLGSVCLFVLAMRRRYLRSGKGKVVLVSHDWGATVAFRLAASVPGIADHFVIMNSALPHLALNNFKLHWSTTERLVRAWTRQPLKIQLLRDAASAISPVVSQLISSSYIFIFNLPAPLPKISGTTCNLWSLRFINDMTQEEKRFKVASVLDTPARRLAATLGPSLAVCGTVNEFGDRYSIFVARRAKDGAFPEAIRLYSEGLATKRWDPSSTVRFALADVGSLAEEKGAPITETRLDGALGAPTTVIWGAKDPALGDKIMITGIEPYLVPGSQVVVLPEVGHWVPAEAAGVEVIGLVVQEAVLDRLSRLEDALQHGVRGVDCKVTLCK